MRVLLVLKTIFYSLDTLVRKILFLPLGNKFRSSCRIQLYVSYRLYMYILGGFWKCWKSAIKQERNIRKKLELQLLKSGIKSHSVNCPWRSWEKLSDVLKLKKCKCKSYLYLRNLKYIKRGKTLTLSQSNSKLFRLPY